jgi:hypothetical protein
MEVVTLRSVAAILAGYMGMTAIVIVGTILATAIFIPGGLSGAPPPPSEAIPAAYTAVSLALSLIAAFCGGWLTGRIAIRRPLLHVGGLAAILVFAAILTVRVETDAGDPPPPAYSAAITVIGLAGVVIGGWLGSRRPSRAADTAAQVEAGPSA